MDCTDDRQPVPSWKGTVVAKVTRIGVEEEEDTEHFDEREFQAAETRAPQQQQYQPNKDNNNNNMDLFGHGANAQPPPTPQQPNLDIFAGTTPASHDFLGMNNGDGQGYHRQNSQQSNQSGGGSHHDAFGLF